MARAFPRRPSPVPIVAACVVLPGVAAAEDAGTPGVTRPVAVEAPAPRCVEGVAAPGVVLLDAVVEVDGAVGATDLVSGEEPFASAAREAVSAHRFEPARRGGEPIAARIRLSVTVLPCAARDEAPAPPTVTRPDPGSVPAPARDGRPSRPPEPDVVDVRGARETSTPTERTLGRSEMRNVPGAFGDPFRAIDVLPGVVPTLSGLPFFYVRGAPPSTVGYFVDEVRVPYLFHFGLGPGVIQPALVDAVSLHPAAFPGRFGRFSGAIVEGRTRDAPTELRGEAQLRLFDAGAYVESPLAGGRAAVGVGGRYSYTSALLSLLSPDVTIDYRDYNARASYALGERTRLTAFAFGSFDYASQVEDGVEDVLFATEFHRLDLRLDHVGADRSTSRVAVTLGLDRTRLEAARFARDHLVGLRARHRRIVSPALEVEVGADALVDFYSGDLPSPYAVEEDDYESAVALFAPRTETATGAWAEARVRPGAGVELTAVARADLFSSAGSVRLGPSPRVSARVPLVGGLAFVAALGVAPQPPAFAIPLPAVGYRGLPGGLSFAYQKSAGLELPLPARFRLTAVGFHHSYFALRDFTQDRERGDIDVPQPSPGSPAQSHGLEAMLARRLSERYSAFVSYTLSRTVKGSTELVPSALSPFDRTHVLQAGGAVDLGAAWRVSSRAVMYSGWPALAPVPGAGERLDAFVRVDARLEKRWPLRRSGWLAFVLEGLNVTGSRDVVGRSCDEGGCKSRYFGPVIVPSAGVEGAL